MKSTLTDSQLQVELKRIYDVRFTGKEAYRNQVWRVLVSKYFSRWIEPGDTVLDVGCGYGEFINNVVAGEKYGIDLNPSSAEHVDCNVRLIQQDCTKPWPLGDDSVDFVFSSNFFEHLPTKQDLQALLLEAHRCLRPGGRLMTLGPNVKHLSGSYWDFFDHHLPLTELSLSEAMLMAGFEVEEAIGKFLPYTMSQGHQPPTWMLQVYLYLPLAWRVFGKQFLVRARKPRPR
jgi:SAM-dependent methyltransferase